MKIPLGGGAYAYLEPDDGPRDTWAHKRIVGVSRIPNTRSGHMLDLECGHRVMTFGNLAHTGGVVLCDQCRQGNGGPKAV